jgi:intracellular septation protein
LKFLADIFPVALFFIAYQLYDIYVATAVAVAASVLQVTYLWLRHRHVPNIQWITLGLLVVFGGLTLLLRDPTFIKWKPTIVNWLMAAAFLLAPLFSSRTLVERMMGHAVNLPEQVWRKLNLAWSVFFIGMGAVNLIVAYGFDEATWVNFKLFGLTGMTLLFALGQGFYLVRYLPDKAAAEASASED